MLVIERIPSRKENTVRERAEGERSLLKVVKLTEAVKTCSQVYTKQKGQICCLWAATKTKRRAATQRY